MTLLAKEANVRRRLDPEIRDTKSHDLLDACAGIKHRRKERVVATAMQRQSINRGEHGLDFGEFQVLDRP
jgi:hypothetical protein